MTNKKCAVPFKKDRESPDEMRQMTIKSVNNFFVISKLPFT
jgi:hypothetical protein